MKKIKIYFTVVGIWAVFVFGVSARILAPNSDGSDSIGQTNRQWQAVHAWRMSLSNEYVVAGINTQVLGHADRLITDLAVAEYIEGPSNDLQDVMENGNTTAVELVLNGVGIRGSSDNTGMVISGGSTTNDGAWIELTGYSYGGNGGNVKLAAGDGEGSIQLTTSNKVRMTLAHNGRISFEDSNIDNDLTIFTNNTAPSGAVLRANGDGSASWTNQLYWDDLRFPASSFNPPGIVTDPDWENVWGGLYLLGFDASTEESIFLQAQMPHGWDRTAIEPHLHITQGSDSSSGTNLWGLEYSWASIGENFNSVSYTNYATNAFDGTQYKHSYVDFPSITPNSSQTGLSSCIIMRLFRNAADDGDTFGQDAYLIEFDIHYRFDRPGSINEASD